MSGGNTTGENQELFSFSLLGGGLHRYGEVFKFYDDLYFDSIVKKKNQLHAALSVSASIYLNFKDDFLELTSNFPRCRSRFRALVPSNRAVIYSSPLSSLDFFKKQNQSKHKPKKLV